MPKLSPPVWGVIVGGGLAGVLLWNAYARDAADTSWTDPQQPPPMVALSTGPAGQRMSRSSRRSCDYPGSLSEWSDCVVGDC